MIWVAWRQFRTQAVVTLAVLTGCAVLLLVTGLHLRDVYQSLGGAHCAARSDCTALRGHDTVLADVLGPALLAIPALLGMFWGASLVARELESGTYRLAWTQSVTRRRWLLVRVALVGVAALAVAGLATWLVSWWFAPVDAVNMNRFHPSVFTARGIVAIGYAGFAFALGVTVGALTRRTLPAMVVTLLGFVAARVAVTLWVRPYLLSAKEVLVPVTSRPGVGFISSAWGVSIAPGSSPLPNAWMISVVLVDRAHHAVGLARLHDLLVRVCPAIVAGLPQTTGGPPKGAGPGAASGAVLACQQRLSHHLQQLVTYQPPSHYWPLQALETGIFLLAALALIVVTVWRLGPRTVPRRADGRRPGDALTRSLGRPGQRSASDASARPQATAGPRAVLRVSARPGLTEMRCRARPFGVVWVSAAFLTMALAVAACGGSSKPVAATSRTGSTSAAAPRTPTASTLSRSAICANEKAQAPAVRTGIPSVALPTTDRFYKWGRPLTHDPPGMILRTRRIAYANGYPHRPLETTQLLYVTTDEVGCRTVSVVTVFRLLGRSPAAPTRILSYQTSYDALGSQCDPSYTLRTGTEGEPGFITSLASAGDTVLMADYEGEDAAYGVGRLSGYQTLDAIRAAETWLRVPQRSTPVGMLGYSGGGVATEFASELAPTYAPRLDIVGVAEGGLPVELFHELTYIDHPSSPWTGQIPSYLDGLARGFHIRGLDRFYTPEGIKVLTADQTQCEDGFAGLTTQQLFKRRYQNIDKSPVFVRMFDASIMSRSGTPRGPLFIANGLSDSTGDGVTVTRDVQQLAYIYCRRGVSVELHIYKGLDHSQAGTPFFAQAQTFLAQRFKNLPFHNRCAAVRPGNSIAAEQRSHS